MGKINTAAFDTVARIDCEISAILASWPDESGFDARTALELNPQLSNHLRAVTAFAVEEFAILIENGGHPTVREFSARFPEVRSDLESRLFNLLSLEAAGHLLSDAPDAEFPRPGQKVGNFHLVEQLGIGAFSRVFLAFDTMMGNRSVVVKVTRRPADECRLAGPLNHPHIARMFSVSVDKETGFTIVCMPYCGRLTCDDLREINPFAYKSASDQAPQQQVEQYAASNPVEFIETALSIICSVGDGIEHMHKHGIVHRDIKPSNIVLSNEMYPTLVDFNASSVFSNSSGVVVGTLPYVAPEILDGIRSGGLAAETISPSADIYALGLVCYEMLAGVLPFDIAKFAEKDGVTVNSIRRAQLCEWTPLRDRNPLISKRLAEIISQATAQSADRRFVNVQEFCKCIRSELSPLKKLARRVRAHSRVAIAGGSVVSILAATALASVMTTGGTSPKPEMKDEYVLDGPNVGPNEDEQNEVGLAKNFEPTQREAAAYDLLAKIVWSKGPAAKAACSEVDQILREAEHHGVLSAESYNNWGVALFRKMDSFESAAQVLSKAVQMLPNNKVVVENQITCEYVMCLRHIGHAPDVQPFIQFFSSLPATEQTDSELLGMAAYCLLRAARQNGDLELAAMARRVAEKGLEVTPTNNIVNSFLESVRDADTDTTIPESAVEDFLKVLVKRKPGILQPPSNHNSFVAGLSRHIESLSSP